MRTQALIILAMIGIIFLVAVSVFFIPEGDSSRAQKSYSLPDYGTDSTAQVFSPVAEASPVSPDIVLSEKKMDSEDLASTGAQSAHSNALNHPADTVASPTIPQPTAEATPTNVPPTGNGFIAGVVKDTRGSPLQGVAVQAEGLPVVFSSPNGAFRCEKILQPKTSITAQIAGFQTVRKEAVPAGTENLEIVLVPEGVVAGIVQDQFDQPVALAQIQAKALEGIWVMDEHADAEGRFSVQNVPKTRIRLQATQDGFDNSTSAVQEVDVPCASVVVLKLTRPTFSISGHVFSKDTQQGINGFHLCAQIQDSQPAQEPLETQTDGTGIYRFENLKQGVYTVSGLSKENSSNNAVIPLNEDFKTVRLFEKSVENVDFYAEAGRTVSGQVLSADNQPIGNAEITIAGLSSAQTRSNQDGSYKLVGVPTTSGQTLDRFELRLMATHSDYGTGLSDPLPNDSAEPLTGINITLQGFAQLSGRVVDQSDAGVSGARVLLSDLSTGKQLESLTDASGGFQFSQVNTTAQSLTPFQGTHKIQAMKENYATIQQRVSLQAGQPQTITLTMELGNTIQGRVLDNNGQPLAGVSVITQNSQGGTVSAVSDPSGVYVLTGLPAGAYDLHFRVDTNPPMTGVLYRVEPGATNADVTLSIGEWIVMGTVYEEGAQLVLHQFILSIEGTPKDPRGQRFLETRSVNTPDGTYQLSFTEPGVYRIRFLATGYEPVEEKADISQETMRVQYINPQLSLAQGTGTIQGTVVIAEGIQLIGVNVPGVSAYPVSNNSFLLEGIPSGNHDLLFIARDQTSGADYELGIFPNAHVIAGQITNLGSLNSQSLSRVQTRNF